MNDAAKTAEHQPASEPESRLQDAAEPKIPKFARDIFPSNVVLSANDLREFTGLIAEANERAKEIEYASLDLEKFGGPEQARTRLNELMVVEYDYRARNGDSVQGLGLPNVEDRSFPDDLESFFASNSTYTQRAASVEPLNTVNVFFGFKRPSLKIDLQHIPSNPTDNPSVINVRGRNEDWVISTAERINDFLRKRRAIRPVIHESGTYDFALYLVFLPTLIWLYHQYSGGLFVRWIADQPVFLNVIVGIFFFLVSLLLYRFIFQYIRWLFPPMEYYRRSRIAAFVHRGVAGVVVSALLLNALYDLLVIILAAIF